MSLITGIATSCAVYLAADTLGVVFGADHVLATVPMVRKIVSLTPRVAVGCGGDMSLTRAILMRVLQDMPGEPTAEKVGALVARWAQRYLLDLRYEGQFMVAGVSAGRPLLLTVSGPEYVCEIQPVDPQTGLAVACFLPRNYVGTDVLTQALRARPRRITGVLKDWTQFVARRDQFVGEDVLILRVPGTRARLWRGSGEQAASRECPQERQRTSAGGGDSHGSSR